MALYYASFLEYVHDQLLPVYLKKKLKKLPRLREGYFLPGQKSKPTSHLPTIKMEYLSDPAQPLAGLTLFYKGKECIDREESLFIPRVMMCFPVI